MASVTCDSTHNSREQYDMCSEFCDMCIKQKIDMPAKVSALKKLLKSMLSDIIKDINVEQNTSGPHVCIYLNTGDKLVFLNDVFMFNNTIMFNGAGTAVNKHTIQHHVIYCTERKLNKINTLFTCLGLQNRSDLNFMLCCLSNCLHCAFDVDCKATVNENTIQCDCPYFHKLQINLPRNENNQKNYVDMTREEKIEYKYNIRCHNLYNEITRDIDNEIENSSFG